MLPAESEAALQTSREKTAVALSSVLAAVFLTVMKLVVGVISNSLGMLSEAAHSGLDLVAATVTFLGVRVSGRPADLEHTYGHGKVENLSALIETMLLLSICVWIVIEAAERLLFKAVVVEAGILAFLTMVVSIIVDFSRSRALMKVARRYDSQALEADALHFSTDIWSSIVVVFGLVLVSLSNYPGLEWLMKMDALAALGVAGIVVTVSLRLGCKAIANLLDTIPSGLHSKVAQAVYGVPGVFDVKQVRVRRVGPEAFADLTLTVDREATFKQAHNIATLAEMAVRKILPGADVVVHMEPTLETNEALPAMVRNFAGEIDGVKEVHGIRALSLKDGLHIAFHLQVDKGLSLKHAHDITERLEDGIRGRFSEVKHVSIHLEQHCDDVLKVEVLKDPRIFQDIRRIVSGHGEVRGLKNPRVYVAEGRFHIFLECLLDEDQPVETAHAVLSHIEEELKSLFPDSIVEIHSEPA
ncbi:cation diffusion facilitator family transporter [Candidatus Bathyarchaeota archaeon]|nr:cation diffusion facilitator family transporter [Candidatus Bathyarchaeota archaeon]